MNVVLSTGAVIIVRRKPKCFKEDLSQWFNDCVVYKPVLALKVFDTFTVYGFYEVVFALFSQETLPGLPVYEVLYRLYPYNSFLAREGRQSVEDLLATFHLEAVKKHGLASIENVVPSAQDQSAQVSMNCNGQQAHFQVRCFVHCVIYVVMSINIDMRLSSA